MRKNIKMHNHIDKNFHLCSKKALLHNIKTYCYINHLNPFDYIPVSFHIQDGLRDPEFFKFSQYF